MKPLNKITEIVKSVDIGLLELFPYVRGRPLMVKITTNEYYNLSIPPFIEIVPQPFYIQYDNQAQLIIEIKNHKFRLKISEIENAIGVKKPQTVKLPDNYKMEFFL